MIQADAAPAFLPGGKTGCILLHGFVSTPREMRWLGEQLHQHGHTVLIPRLFGHSTRPDDLYRVRWTDWLADVESYYKLLMTHTEQIVLIGLSMGAALALYAATSLPVAGVVALSTPYRMPPLPLLSWLSPFLPLLRPISRVIRALPKPPPLDYYDQKAAKNHLGYRVLPTYAIAEVTDLVTAMRNSLSQVHAPALIIHSTHDGGVHPSNARLIYSHLGARQKQLLWVENSGHVILLEPERERAAEAIQDFVTYVHQEQR